MTAEDRAVLEAARDELLRAARNLESASYYTHAERCRVAYRGLVALMERLSAPKDAGKSTGGMR